MTKTLHVVYDGAVLRPKDPGELAGIPMNVPLEVVLEEPRLEPGASLRVLVSLGIEGLADSAEHFDEYLQAIRSESER